MPHPYRLTDENEIATPALIFYPEFIERNIHRVIELAGTADRLRPHAKTHKTRAITRLQLAAGIRKHKCATLAEAEMLAEARVPDVLIAYQLVGPNIGRLGRLAGKYRSTQFSALIDSAVGAEGLSHAAMAADRPIGFLVDLDVGQHRTGIAPGPSAIELYEQSARLPGLLPLGFHAYDGHNTEPAKAHRQAIARHAMDAVLGLRKTLMERGHPVPHIVAGGTPSFPIYAGMKDVAGLECSPGTYVLHDFGYSSKYPDITGITSAAILLTRVVSRPTPNRVTFDLGSKAVAPDLTLAQRAHFLDDADAIIVGHNEEHLIIETPNTQRWFVGAVGYVLPGHVCPSVALHREALLAGHGKIFGKWEIAARDRTISP